MGLALLRSGLLSPALLAAALGCGPAAPPREVLEIPPAPRGAPAAVNSEPSLRLLAQLANPGWVTPMFFPDAGVVIRCQGEADACVLRGRETLLPASDFARFVDLEEYEADIFSQSGPWPRRAWMSALLSHPEGGRPFIGVFAWTDSGWSKQLELVDESSFLGAGEWIGGRVITPVIHVYYNRQKSDKNGESPREITEKPRFAVISGPPSDDLPLLEAPLGRFAHSFTSLPSGHMYLVSWELEGRDTVVERWGPGDRRPTQDAIPGIGPASIGGRDSYNPDPTQNIIAVSPDEVYIAGDEPVSARGTASDRKVRPAVAHFNGRAWDVSFLPTTVPRIKSFRRSPDGTLWLLCGEGWSTELWRRPPREVFQRVKIPEIYADGTAVTLFFPEDIWPRGAGEVRLIAQFEPRPRSPKIHGIFLLELPERPAAPPARR